MKSLIMSLHFVLLAGAFLAAPMAQAQNTNNSDQIPRQVLNGLKAKFSKPTIEKWTKENEGGLVVFDIEFTQEGRKFEADIAEDGTIKNWEKAIAAEDLPSAVRNTVGKKYPRASMKEIMQITTIANGKEKVEGYEILLRTTENKSVEVTIAPDGKVLEDSGESK